MPSTPPPRSTRLHTPPAPLHGPRDDSWEPYSPRRSGRVKAQRSAQTTQNLAIKTFSVNETPKHRPNSTTARRNQPGISPPSSPHSPVDSDLLQQPKVRRNIFGASPASHSISKASPVSVSADSNNIGLGRSTNITETFGMLPTPAKTPKKRHVGESAIKKTSRVLFPGRTVTADEAMPSPRKVRHHNKQDEGFSIDTLIEEAEDENGTNAIAIFTDSKERVPSVGGDDNPFLTKAGSRSRSNGTKCTKSKQKSEKELRMDEAVRDDEGLVYVFRGKRVFRKYDNVPNGDNSAGELSDLDIRRRAGKAVDRPLTRSKYQPRLLFANEEQRREREQRHLNDEDEEAMTDIESPTFQDQLKAPAEDQAATTPVRDSFSTLPATPPSTTRTTRSRTHIHKEIALDIPSVASFPSARSTRGSLFDDWARIKHDAAALKIGKGTKREGDDLTGDRDTGKRTRSGYYASN